MGVARVLDGVELAALSTRSGAQHAAALLAIDYLPALPVGPASALVAEARGWLADCGWDVEELEQVGDAVVVAVVDREYERGWAGFVIANVDLLADGPSAQDPAGGVGP